MRLDGFRLIARRDWKACGIHYGVVIPAGVRKKSEVDLRERGAQEELKTKKNHTASTSSSTRWCLSDLLDWSLLAGLHPQMWLR
jgi:hypothetical protein